MRNKRSELVSRLALALLKATGEIGWGPQEKAEDYLKGRIPGSNHFKTDWIQEGPLWNLSLAETIQSNLEKPASTIPRPLSHTPQMLLQQPRSSS